MTDESRAIADARIDLGAVTGVVLARAPRIILVTLVLLLVTYVLLSFSPRIYESTAGILVEPRVNLASTQAPTAYGGGEAGVVSSQIELIRSRDTLLRAIDETDLRNVPEFAGGNGFSPLGLVSRLLGRGPTQEAADGVVLSNLLDALTIVQQRDSRVISISVRSRDPELAARLANAIAHAHVRRRAELSLSDTAEASGWLAEEIEKLRVSVADAEGAVAEFRVANDLFTGANNTSLLDQQLSTIASQINAAQERKNVALQRSDLIRRLIEEGRSIEGVPDVQSSAVIQQLSQERARLQGERAQLSATLLPSHPSIRAMAAQIGEIDAQLRSEGRQIAEALEAESRIEAGIESSLRADLESLKTSASAATRQGVTLQGLEREAEAQRDLLEGYLRRYREAVSRTDANSALPDVRVITIAAPAVSPASPQTTMILLAVAIVSLTSQIGIVIFGELISGRALSPAVLPQARREPDHVLAEDAPISVAEPLPAGPAYVRDAVVVPVDADTPPGAHAVSDDAEPDVLAGVAVAAGADAADDEVEQVAPATIVPESRSTDNAIEVSVPVTSAAFERLSSDLALGRSRIVIIAAHGEPEISDTLAVRLCEDLLDRGLSVAIVDAGSRRPTAEFGIADLSVEEAGFGDIVHRSADENFADIPWGQSHRFDVGSRKPATLVAALSDVFEVVLVLTGRLGVGSTLPAFAGAGDRTVLVTEDETEDAELAEVVAELTDAGYGPAELVRAPSPIAA